MGLGFFLGGASEGVNQSANTVGNLINQQRQLKFQDYSLNLQMEQKKKEMAMQEGINKFNQWKGRIDLINSTTKTAETLPPIARKGYVQNVLGQHPVFSQDPNMKALVDLYPDEPEMQSRINKIFQGAGKDMKAGKDVSRYIFELEAIGTPKETIDYFKKELGIQASKEVTRLLSEGSQQPTGMVGQSNFQRDFNIPTGQGLLMGSGQPNLQEKTVNRPATLGDFTNVIPFIGENDFARKLLEREFVPKERTKEFTGTDYVSTNGRPLTLNKQDGKYYDVDGNIYNGKVQKIYKPEDINIAGEKKQQKQLNSLSQAMLNIARKYKSSDQFAQLASLLQNKTLPQQDQDFLGKMSLLDRKRYQELETKYGSILNEMVGIQSLPTEIVKPQGMGKIPIFK